MGLGNDFGVVDFGEGFLGFRGAVGVGVAGVKSVVVFGLGWVLFRLHSHFHHLFILKVSQAIKLLISWCLLHTNFRRLDDRVFLLNHLSNSVFTFVLVVNRVFLSLERVLVLMDWNLLLRLRLLLLLPLFDLSHECVFHLVVVFGSVKLSTFSHDGLLGKALVLPDVKQVVPENLDFGVFDSLFLGLLLSVFELFILLLHHRQGLLERSPVVHRSVGIVERASLFLILYFLLRLFFCLLLLFILEGRVNDFLVLLLEVLVLRPPFVVGLLRPPGLLTVLRRLHIVFLIVHLLDLLGVFLGLVLLVVGLLPLGVLVSPKASHPELVLPLFVVHLLVVLHVVGLEVLPGVLHRGKTRQRLVALAELVGRDVPVVPSSLRAFFVLVLGQDRLLDVVVVVLVDLVVDLLGLDVGVLEMRWWRLAVVLIGLLLVLRWRLLMLLLVLWWGLLLLMVVLLSGRVLLE